MLGAIGSALISGGASLLGGLLDKPKSNKGMNSSIRKTNMKNVAKANKQEEAWNKAVQIRADRAAKVPIVTTTSTKYGSGEKTTHSQKDVTTYGRTDTTEYGRRVDTRSYVDVDRMMAAAEKSGFNPVTFLQAGGLQAYTQGFSQESGRDVFKSRGSDVFTSRSVDTLTRYGRDDVRETVTGSTAMQAALVGLDKPGYHYYEGATDATASSGTSVGQAIGNGLNAGVNSYMAVQQQLDQNDFQKGLVQQQLLAANRSGTGRGYSLNVPRSVSSHATVGNGWTGNVNGGATNGVSTVTPWGRLTNPAPLGSAAYSQFGDILGPFVQLGSEGPAMWNDPGNQKAASDAAKAWYWGADDLVGAGVKKSWNDFVQGTRVGNTLPLTYFSWTKPGTPLRRGK